MLLWLLWSLVLLLTGLVLMLLAGLTIGRAVSAAFERRRAARREAIMQRVLVHLDQAEGNAEADAGLEGVAADVASVLRELGDLVRGGSRARLIALARAAGVVDHLLARLGHWRPGTRALAASDLQLFEDPRVLAALRARLADRSYEVRLAAARSLVRMGAVEDVAGLIPHLLDTEGRAPPRRLGRLFQELSATQGAQLVDLVRGDLPVPVRELALEALGTVADVGPVVVIRAVARDPAPVVRQAGFRALARLGHPSARFAVGRGLEDTDPGVRTEAARCAARLGLEALLPQLRRLLEDDVWRVRKGAVDALAGLGEAGRAALRDALRERTRAADLAALAV